MADNSLPPRPNRLATILEACRECGKQRWVRPSRTGRLCKRCTNFKHRGPANNFYKHGGSHDSKTRSPLDKSLYNVWSGMRQRCLNPNNHAYADYGGRGITICDRWREDYAAFKEDMGTRPKGKCLNRIDNNGPYSPENCQWATMKQQSNNRRHKRPVSLLKLLDAIFARVEGTVS